MNWAIGKLSDISTVISGYAFKSEWFGEGHSKIIRIGDLQENRINTEFAVTFNSERNRVSNQYQIKNNDILMALSGATVGKIGVATSEDNGHYLNQRVAIIRGNNEINARYLRHVFSGNFLQKLLMSAGGAAQPNLSPKNLSAMEIPIPSLADQKRIAAILDKAAEIKAKREKAIAKLDELAQSTFVEMFGNPLLNHKGYDLHKLQDVAIFENGDRSSNYPSGDDIKEKGVLFLSTKNIKDNQLFLEGSQFITEEKYKSLTRGKVKNGDLVITLRGTLGSCCIFNLKNSEAFINAQMMIIRPKEMINETYLHGLITSNSFQKQLQRIGNGAAVPQLTATQLKDLLIPIPSIKQQIAFKHVIEVVANFKAKLNNAIKSVDTAIKSLQHQAFTTGFNT